MSLNMWTKSLQENLADTRKDLHEELNLMLQVEGQTTKALIQATWHDFQTQLKEVEVQAECRRGTGSGLAKPPKFDGTTTWAMFQHHFETIAKHNYWMRLEKSTSLITVMLHRVPKGTIYEITLQALEDHFGDLATAYSSQLKTRTKDVRESLQEFETVIEQLAHLCGGHYPRTI
jgi:hypothetical protein